MELGQKLAFVKNIKFIIELVEAKESVTKKS